MATGPVTEDQHSAISGELIDGDSAVDIVVSFTDGTQRRLTVTRSEAGQLKSRGSSAGRAKERSGLSRVTLGKLVKWAAALVIASIVLPALTRQWSDRQSELTLKESVIEKVSAGAVASVTRAENVLRFQLSGEQATSANHDALQAWEDQEATLDALVHTYFDGTPFLVDWNAFQGAVYNFLYISCCTQDRTAIVADLQKYLVANPLISPQLAPPAAPDPWTALASSDYSTPAASAAYQWLGGEILRERGSRLLPDLLREHACGYSTTPADFVRAIFFQTQQCSQD